MTRPIIFPDFTRGQVDRAGNRILAKDLNATDFDDHFRAIQNWRSAHAYPINTFQATLRTRLRQYEDAFAAQRLKRIASILGKLQRFPTMRLSQMQDIAGLRAVLPGILQVTSLYNEYVGSKRFPHELVSVHDYTTRPKDDGYRGIHLIYRYRNTHEPRFNGLLLELQIRTLRQHYWATAVEATGSLLRTPLKSGIGDESWLEFFRASSDALKERDSLLVRGNRIPESFQRLESRFDAETKLRQIEAMSGIQNVVVQESNLAYAYHLIVLDLKSLGLEIRPFSRERIDEATEAYREVERRIREGAQLDAVLVSAGPMQRLRSAYPNYFLDTVGFVTEIREILRIARDG